MHNNDRKTPYIDIYIDLLSINFTVRALALCLPFDKWFWNLHFANNIII